MDNENIVEKVVTTTFADDLAHEAPVDDRRADSSLVNNSAAVRSDMSDRMWMIKEMMAKPRVLETVAFATSNSLGEVLSTYALPSKIFDDSDTLQYHVFRLHTFMRPTMKFQFRVNATRFHVGRLMAVWVPLKVPAPQNIYQATGFVHAIIDIANSKTTEMTIPWFHKFSMINNIYHDEDIQLGKMYIMVLNPLQATSGVSSSIDLSVYAWLEDCELRFPISEAIVPAPAFRAMETQGLFDVVKDVFSTGSKIVDSASNVVDRVERGQFGAAVSDFGRAIQQGESFVNRHPELKAMMFDRPKDNAVNWTSKRMVFSSLSYGCGPDTVERLGLNPDGMHIPDENVVAGHVNDTSLSAIVETPMMFSQINWLDSAAPQTVLAAFPINPLALVNSLNPTYLGYVSSAFTYWRGSIDIRLDVVASQFHTGRLMCVYVPGYQEFITVPSFTACTSCPNVVLDIANTENKSFTLNFPFVCNKPWLFCQTFDNSTSKMAGQSIVGTFYIFILNKLSHPDNVSNNVTINLYVSAGKDYQLAIPVSRYPLEHLGNFPRSIQPLSNVNFTTLKDNSNNLVKLERQGVEESVEPQQRVDMLQMQAAPIGVDVKHFFNEFSNDLRDYIRRYGVAYNSFILGFPNSDNSFCTQVIPVQPICLNTNRLGLPLSFISRLFVGWSGSIRYKILTNSSALNPGRLIIRHDPYYYAATPATIQQSIILGDSEFEGPAAIKLANGAFESCYEIEVPWVNNMHFCEIFRDNSSSSAPNDYTNGTLWIGRNTTWVHPTFEEQIAVTLYVAAGDDYCLHYLIPPRADSFNMINPFHNA